MVIMALRGCAQSCAKTALTARRNMTSGLKSKSSSRIRFASLALCQGRRMASSMSSVTYYLSAVGLTEFSIACITLLRLSPSVCYTYNSKYEVVWGHSNFKCYVTQMGVGGVKFSGKKRYEGVRFNVISVTRG